MNIKMIARIIGYILFVEVALMLPAFAISIFMHEAAAMKGFIYAIVIALIVGALLCLFAKNAKRDRFYAREGMATTGISWIAMSLVGAVPFYVSKEIPSFIDAFFEIVSGFTTTGSSILLEVESMSKGLLFWRSFSHWIGGMGVLVFLMAIVSLGKKNQGFSLHILRAESPGPSVGKIVPRIKQTAAILYVLYIVLTVVDIAFLLLGGMNLFEACCIAFGTAGTGGFGVKNDSLASYSSYIQTVTTIFMFLFSVNFSIYYMIVLRRFKEVIRDEEFHLFLGMIMVSITLITWNVLPMFSSLKEAVHHVAFTVGTVMSTTGYATVDFDQWPSFAKSILFILMMIGACAGSTGGGMKQVRILLLLKKIRQNIHKSLHPSEVKSILVNGRAMDEGIIDNTTSYLIAYAIIVILSFIIISLDGFDLETNVSAIIATFNNIGPGFAKVGATCNFAAFSPVSKLVMCFDMLAGRLEIFPMLLLLSRSTWKRAR